MIELVNMCTILFLTFGEGPYHAGKESALCRLFSIPLVFDKVTFFDNTSANLLELGV